MVTFSSCLIWQIISFILPPNKYGCVLKNAGKYWQKRSSFQMKLILILVVDEKQNFRIWGKHAYIEKPTHPNRVTVWCGFWSRDIIGLFFFENEQEGTVTVNADRNRAMLNEFLFTKIEEKDIANISTGRRYVPHSWSYTWCFAPCF